MHIQSLKPYPIPGYGFLFLQFLVVFFRDPDKIGDPCY
jgi:hypothetical protein